MEQHSSIYQRNPDFIFRRIVEEMILVPIHQDIADMNCIYTLNDVGAFLWEKLADPATEEELENAVLEVYETERETAARDVSNFLVEMERISALRKVEV